MPTFVVCAPTGHFADDVRTHCAVCRTPIVHRPHVPAGSTKICQRCGGRLLESHPDATIGVTEETVREVALFNAKTRGSH